MAQKPMLRGEVIILATDADFDHTGALSCVSGVVALMNGGVIAWKVRRQTTRSANSTEAEVKACSLGFELIRAHTGLYGEFMHTAHGIMRSMIDCTGARPLIRGGMDAKASAPNQTCPTRSSGSCGAGNRLARPRAGD